MKIIMITMLILVLTITPVIAQSSQEIEQNFVGKFASYIATPTIDKLMELYQIIFNVFDRLEIAEARVDYLERSCDNGGGSNHVTAAAPVIYLEGDINNDGKVDLDDFVIYKQRLNQLKEDVLNGLADIDDVAKFKLEYQVFQNNFGK